MQFYSYMSIRLHSILCQASLIACLRLRVAVLEDLQKEGGARLSRTGCGSSACSSARVQANGNNVIVLINRDTASVLCGRRPGISA